MPSPPPLFLTCLLSCGVGTVATGAPKTTAKVNPELRHGVLRVPCSLRAESEFPESNCWQSLAKAVRENPKVNYFSVEGEITGNPVVIFNLETATFTRYRWFYNKKVGAVDYKETLWIPPEQWGVVNTIKRYEGLTPAMLADFAKQHASKTRDKVFDDFCDLNGVYVLNVPNAWQKTKPKAPLTQ